MHINKLYIKIKYKIIIHNHIYPTMCNIEHINNVHIFHIIYILGNTYNIYTLTKNPSMGEGGGVYPNRNYQARKTNVLLLLVFYTEMLNLSLIY